MSVKRGDLISEVGVVFVRVMNAVLSEVVAVARFASAVAVSCCISNIVTSSS